MKKQREKLRVLGTCFRPVQRCIDQFAHYRTSAATPGRSAMARHAEREEREVLARLSTGL